MKSITITFVFVLFILFPSISFSQKKNTTRGKSTKSPRRITSITEVLQAEDRKWIELVSKQGNFKILFPGEPKYFVGNNKFTKENKFTEHKLETNFRTYTVGFGDFNNIESITDEQREKIYDITRDGIVKDAKGTLINDNKLQIGNVFGREITYEQENYLVTNRYFFKGNTFYQLITVVKKYLSKGTNIQEFGKKFLDSFQFVE